MKNLIQLATLSLAFSSLLSGYAFAQANQYPGMPANIEAQLRDIGNVVDGQRTTGIYAPLLDTRPFSGKAVSRDLAYGSHERHVLDLITTPVVGNGKPVVVFVHGGGFGFGAKSSATSPFYDNIMTWAVDQGMVGISINYRLAPEFQWPSGVEDLTQVITWIQNNVADYGGDADKVFLWGHSAGAAHVGDYLAWQANNGQDDGVAGAVLTSGFYIVGPEESIWASYYGDDQSTYAEKSSLSGLLLTDTPLLVNDAELDPDNFKADSITITEAFAEAGKTLTRVSLSGHSHISETYAIGTEDQSLSGPVKDFIQNIVQ